MKSYNSKTKELQLKEDFDRNFIELADFLKINKKFPESENPKLYAWIISLMTEYKKRQLDEKCVSKLNSIGFVWSRRDLIWYNKAAEVKKMLIEDNTIPRTNNNEVLYHWLNFNRELFNKDLLPEGKRVIFKEINEIIKNIQNSIIKKEVAKISAREIKIPVREIKWEQKLNSLIKFRKENPKSWPQVESLNEAEKKLGVWCQDLRHRFRKNLLEEVWILKLEEIGFNFDGKLNEWKNKYKELRAFLQIKHKAPDTKNELYTWARGQFNRFNELTQEKQELLESINFLSYFEDKDWNKRYAKFKEYVISYNKAPTKKSNKGLYNWLTAQRRKYKNGKLTDNESSLLLKLGVDLSPINNRERIWNLKYEALVKFREENPDRWPSFFSEGIEKKLYEWCQAQRQVYSRTAQRRRELPQERIEKLNKIGFYWSLDELLDKNWNYNFLRLEIFINKNGGSNIIPAKIDNEYNSIYTWLRNQKKAIQKGKLSLDKYEKLKSLGVI